MYGLPGQTELSWLKTLEEVIRFQPEHISCYQLTLEDHTPLGKMAAEGKINALGEEEERAFFILTSTFLQGNGYVHYEISNFARGEEKASRHNRKYWERVPYLGLGPSAHSFQEGIRWWNVRNVQSYCERLRQGLPPLAGKERLTEEQNRLESLMLGFRTKKGIHRGLIASEAGFASVIRELRDSGLVEIVEERVVPTLEGFLVADSIPLLF
jgi:oxygen-independent coproporphyrinogen-3 oxidase